MNVSGMSYNNIGLQTARGSGTNGYVQRNFATIRPKRDPLQSCVSTPVLRCADGRRERDESRRSEYSEKKPNAELLEHERKRNIELKCVELQDEMEEQGFVVLAVPVTFCACSALVLRCRVQVQRHGD